MEKILSIDSIAVIQAPREVEESPDMTNLSPLDRLLWELEHPQKEEATEAREQTDLNNPRSFSTHRLDRLFSVVHETRRMYWKDEVRTIR